MTDAECFWQARRAIYLSGPMSSYPVLLPGFIKSVGVSAELALARNCGLEAFLWPSFDRIM